MELGIRSHDLMLSGERYLMQEEVTKRLTKLKIDGVQLTPFKTFKDIRQIAGQVNKDFANITATNFSQDQKKIFLIASYFNPVHSDTEKVLRCKAVFKEYLSLAKNFNTTMVASETGSFNDDKWTYHPSNRTPKALKQVVQTFSELCTCASINNVNVGIEGAWGHVCYDIPTLKKAIFEIASENLVVVFDIYNFLNFDNYKNAFSILEQGLNSFSGKISCFHLKDFIVENGELKQVSVGKGYLDYTKLLKTIKSYDSNANLILEGTVGEDIKYSVDYVRRIWEDV